MVEFIAKNNIHESLDQSKWFVRINMKCISPARSALNSFN